MPESKAPRDVLAEVMAEGRKTLVPYLAEMLKTERIAEVPPDEERRRFWQRAKTPEQEQQLWAEALAQRGLTPETLDPQTALDIGLGISKEVYPGRWDMMAAEGRNTQADQARWAFKHAQHGPPKAMQEEGEQDGNQRGSTDVQQIIGAGGDGAMPDMQGGAQPGEAPALPRRLP